MTVNYPSSPQIRNLMVDAPSDSSNLLLLNYAGTSTPRRWTKTLRSVIGSWFGPSGAKLYANPEWLAVKLGPQHARIAQLY